VTFPERDEYRREHQAAGIEQAKKKGKYKGRVNGTGNPARVQELRDNGLTGPEIATALGISLRTVFCYMSQKPATCTSR
jgi:DNA invertase Pin-like site-specific DNA recombinase